MDKTVKTTGTVMEGQIDKTDMDEEVKTAGTKTGGQIDKAGNRPRQHQAESHGSGSSRSVSDTVDESFLLDRDDLLGATFRYFLVRRWLPWFMQY